jgi:hypothetical protein
MGSYTKTVFEESALSSSSDIDISSDVSSDISILISEYEISSEISKDGLDHSKSSEDSEMVSEYSYSDDS